VKPLKWMGSSKKDIGKFPKNVQEAMGFALLQAQKGEKHIHVKPLKGIKALECVERDKSGTYRVIYTVEIKGVIYVLHAFQKKSKKGIATPLQDINLIKKRLVEVKNLSKQVKK